MCCNAMTYNRMDTIYYRTAKRLLHIGSKVGRLPTDLPIPRAVRLVFKGMTAPHLKKVVKYTRNVCQNVKDILLDMLLTLFQKILQTSRDTEV